jgi:hypothetical protein
MKIGNSNLFFVDHFGEGLWNSEIFHKVIEHPSCSFVVILLYGVANAMQNHQFEFALHLGNC